MKNKSLLRTLLQERPVSLSNQLFNLVDDYEIYCSLIGEEIELGETVTSPIRESDECPSFALFMPTRITTFRPEEIWFKDLADGRFGNIFTFTKYYALHHYGLVLDVKYDIIKFIDEQLELGILSGNPVKRDKIERGFSKKETKIRYKSRPFTKRDKLYWGQFGLTEEDLNKFNVKSVKYLLEEHSGLVRKEFKTKELVFVYQIWDKLKLYQPEASRSFKFRNTCPGDDFRYYQGFEQLTKKTDTLIITKSYKDLMVFWKTFNDLGTPIDIIAPHAESINLSKEFVQKVKITYKNIICVSDYDLAGVKFANQCKRHGFKYRFISTKRTKINGKFKVLDKDISDFTVNHGLDETKKLLESWDLSTT